MEFDPQALEQYRLRLRYKVCYHLGSFCPDVDDVVQETLTRVVTALRDRKIHNPASIGAFLSGVCNNVILEYRRRLWRDGLPEPDPPEHVAQAQPEAEALELRDLVASTLAGLSDRDAGILRAFYLEERDKDDICRSMDISDAQFRVALFRAKERFRKIYQQRLKQIPPRSH